MPFPSPHRVDVRTGEVRWRVAGCRRLWPPPGLQDPWLSGPRRRLCSWEGGPPSSQRLPLLPSRLLCGHGSVVQLLGAGATLL